MGQKFITIRIPYGALSAIGPGKADLLEAIDRRGSISAAAKDMGMSYKRAWDLVDTMNHAFREPLVETATGGSHGGGAQISEFGYAVLHRYREAEAKANASIAGEMGELVELLSPAATQ
ncbi:MAG: LysR family transcriptional regulator [Nitrosomonadales bacterium]|jgi:molybdate transport system regulatory protein|nr:MAG: LysR family transcriptional regulator [Nitrosomonadales bacterium]